MTVICVLQGEKKECSLKVQGVLTQFGDVLKGKPRIDQTWATEKNNGFLFFEVKDDIERCQVLCQALNDIPTVKAACLDVELQTKIQAGEILAQWPRVTLGTGYSLMEDRTEIASTGATDGLLEDLFELGTVSEEAPDKTEAMSKAYRTNLLADLLELWPRITQAMVFEKTLDQCS